MRSICISIVATLALVGTSFAATINVPGDHATIQGAIDASSDGHFIAIAAGTYNEANLNPNGKAITIGSASGTLDVTIDAQQGGSVFVIGSGETSGTVIKDLVMTGGSASQGGGIWCSGSSPTISGCTIESNTTNGSGGTIFCFNSNPTISDCTISANTANDGGGIFCYNGSNPTISGCMIYGNTTNGSGGGIYSINSNPTISGCTISGNTANDDGGGIWCSQSSATNSPTCSDCTISGNTANDGGGIYCMFNINGTISGCTISGNTANYDGGGIYCASDSSQIISGCTISENIADGSGGGIYCNENSNTTISVCTFIDNMPDVINGSDKEFTLGELGSADPPVTGACCVTSGCDPLTEESCTNVGGTWLGEGGSCDDCAPTCQGDANADGTVDIFDLLKVIDGWGTCP